MPAILLVNDNGHAVQQLRFALSSVPQAEIVNHVESAQECLLLLASTRASIALIRPRLPDGSGLDLIDQIQKRRPQLQVIVTMDGNEASDVWTRIVQLGLRNIITPPYAPDAVAQAVAAASHNVVVTGGETEKRALSSYVVAVTSARGGVGKTLVATNLAACMAEWSDRVTLLDFAGQPGDFTVMLDDVPRNTIADLLSAGEAIEPDFLDTLIAVHPRLGLRYLASPSQEFNIGELNKPLARDVAANMRQISDYVIIDTGDCNSAATQASLMECDVCFVITTRDVIRLMATQRYIKRMAEWEVDPTKIKVLVNCAEVGAEISDTEIESILEHQVAAYLPSNPAPATYSINSGKPLTINDPKQPLAVVLTKLAEFTFRRWSETAAQGAPEKIRGKGGKTGRLGFG